MNHPYLPLTDPERERMLQVIGVPSFTALLQDIPEEVLLTRPLQLPGALSEPELTARFQAAVEQNILPQLSFLGAGAYRHYIPALVDHLANRSEFYTAYTPYQPEISQGILQAIFEYQTMICELFGLPVANASLYDGATALAEAVMMAARETRRSRILVPAGLNPALLQVLETYTRPHRLQLVTIPAAAGVMTAAALTSQIDTDTAAVVIQTPNFWGCLENLPELIPLIKNQGALPICYTQPITLGLLEAPGRLGAEIVVAEGQPLGIPLAYGGPYLGLMAVSDRLLRRIPGRVVGATRDREGKQAFVLTLQTREQHIRREKATSNICSNQALCALRAAIYLAVLGPTGLATVAERCFNNAHYLQGELEKAGFPPLFAAPFFMEFAVKTAKPAAYYLEALAAKGITAGFDLSADQPQLGNALLVCATEVLSKAEIDLFVSELKNV